jgi:hypothetical protein
VDFVGELHFSIAQVDVGGSKVQSFDRGLYDSVIDLGFTY